MENKTTTELINLLHSLKDKEGNLKKGYNEALEELKNREPFWTILDEDYEESIPAIMGYIKSLEAEVKLLKRHKHDEKTGDVMVRV
ncbi:MAG: hypothetical protein AABY22_28540 [Nanoarchaeota archaeon]